MFDQQTIRCTSMTATRFFRFSREELKKAAHQPFSKGVWQALLINNLSVVVEGFADTAVYIECQQQAILGDAEFATDPIFHPFADHEVTAA